CAEHGKKVHRIQCTKTTPDTVYNGKKVHRIQCTPGGANYTGHSVQNGQTTPDTVQNAPKSTPDTVRRNNNNHNKDRGALSEDAKALVDGAVDLYNHYAEKHDFRCYLTRSDATDRRFHARLLKIGGLEKFELALSVIHTVDFYMGRV